MQSCALVLLQLLHKLLKCIVIAVVIHRLEDRACHVYNVEGKICLPGPVMLQQWLIVLCVAERRTVCGKLLHTM